MGRKKSRPVRSGAIPEISNTSNPNPDNVVTSESETADPDTCQVSDSETFYVGIDCSNSISDEHLDIAQVILGIVDFADEMKQSKLVDRGLQKSDFSLRFCLLGVDEGSFRLGKCPVLPANHILVEYGVLEKDQAAGGIGESTVLFSGTFDGPDEGVSALVHLVSQKFLTLRLLEEVGNLRIVPSLRFRVEILSSAFDASELLLEISRHPWRKSMMNLMSWIRPEVTTSEAIYGLNGSKVESCDLCPESGDSLKRSDFNAAEFYEAIKPSKDEPMLEENLSDLLPHLRPYQRRAAYWMVQREKGFAAVSRKIKDHLSFPFCVPVNFLGRNSKMFYNPFNGNVSLQPKSSSSYVSGGILADEMGLGKTVELLACILTHRRLSVQDNFIPDDGSYIINCQIERQKRERVECVCGAASENPRYRGLWVQCDVCDAWQHANCVGFSQKKKPSASVEVHKKKGTITVLPLKSDHWMERRTCRSVVESDENYVCSMCFDLEAAKIKISTGATLIVCPAPILAQWNSEINRHTRSGSLKICIYEGARNSGSIITLNNDVNELAAADIVLTTYDVLKEDLSHDFDRHDGDHRFMRFQKRYPVLPTLLTRIHWWRLCLDEAQMVECRTASVTEMAMRLHAQHRWCITGTPIQRKLDDMYGLLRFLRASPFDIYRWWVEVIRDPYERKDVVAMEFVHKFFQQIMWRSSKIHVSEELQLPPQEESLSWLTFSPIEEHFYQKQHATCVRFAHEIIRTFKMAYSQRSTIPGFDVSCTVSISHNEAEKLLVTLLKLRQACCHPQVGSSGLCSLQSSPLTMEEILEVLIGRAKIEGEEDLRKIVVALNGLAGIAVIEKDSNKAVSVYKEALALADDNFNDFRLDPLLSIHIHHNLAELQQLSPEYSPQSPLMAEHLSENNGDKRAHGFVRFNQYYVKRQKTSEESRKGSSTSEMSLERCRKLDNVTAHLSNTEGGERKFDAHYQTFCRCYSFGCLKKTCENIKQNYLSTFNSKLSLARQDFRNSHMQVSNMSKECNNQSMVWWLHALDFIEKNKDTSEDLLAKIDQAISMTATTSSKSLKITSRIRTISGLKYTIQTGLDFLETSRRTLINRIIDIDETMENPKDIDFERKRYCPKCSNGNGSLCIHCELDRLFQVYEAGLFLLKKASNGAVIACEEAIEMQKQNAALNHFSSESKMSIKTNIGNVKNRQRQVKGGIQVSKSASPLEITLGVIKSFSRTILGRQGVALARKHLILFEAMRKEFAQARFLQVAQSQLFGAYDEIKMSTSRMRLKETPDEPNSMTVLSREELVSHSLQYSSDKVLSLASLTRIKGQLRYLKGLMVSNQKVQGPSSMPEHTDDLENSPIATEQSGALSKTNDELCPICQENLYDPKMMFPCGHVICCKCCLQMTEKVMYLQKWVMCPTCRQHTDIELIAYVDERKDKRTSLGISSTLQAKDIPESCIRVHGSYGTKIEAVTRRILWIASSDQEAKVIVFSSWNDVLDVLAHALVANNITYVRMKGGRKSQEAIAKFRGLQNVQGHAKVEEEFKLNPIRVLLLLVHHGANGLNILEAQHVILVEPLLNPAAEAQAISRVHRVGQEKKTFVHRFIVENTVEESIYKLNRSRGVRSVLATRSKHQDKTTLTIQDVESLFPMTTPDEDLEDAVASEGSFRHLPPAVAAGLAAERRLIESQNNTA